MWKENGRRFLDIVNFTIRENIAKEDKIGVFDWSYGGYATLRELSFEADIFACGIAMYGLRI